MTLVAYGLIGKCHTQRTTLKYVMKINAKLAAGQ